MIRAKHIAVALLALAALNGCGSDGGKAEAPPGGLQVTTGDGVVTIAWAEDPSVNYWLFISTDPTMTVDNFSTRSDIRILRDVHAPFTICGYPDGRQLYFAMNGRTGKGPGGPGTATVTALVRAAGDTWTAGSAAPIDFATVAYTPITSCLTTGLPTGIFVGVGANAAIATSTDLANTFVARTPPSGFTTDLTAVTGLTINLNNPSDPNLRIVAVGAGGGSVVSTDGVNFITGATFDPAAPTLRAVATVAGAFVAVGDGGSARTSTDGITWTSQTTNSTANLLGIGCIAATCLAVGQNGTILRSVDVGVTWTPQPITGSPTLRHVIYGSFNNNIGASVVGINTWVAVGDGGVAYWSIDNGTTWNAVTVPGAGDLVTVSYLTRFVAIDSTGSAFFSFDGQTWSGPVATGLSVARTVTTNGVGFVAVGAGGQAVSAF